ncbi:MAG: DUF2721 domain-containing protein, partial [Bradyrhizobium sp.]|nr:DUF2721 domain-containing protein [Bradyrhizobium sp.]
MQVTLKDFLEVVAPSASLIFASWIFLSFLQTRYTSACSLYRSLIEIHRQNHSQDDEHQRNVSSQIALYKRRCQQMRAATNLGVIAALLLIIAIICAVLEIVTDVAVFRPIGVTSTLLGFFLLVVAAAFVIMENSQIQYTLSSELEELPELQDKVREVRGWN